MASSWSSCSWETYLQAAEKQQLGSDASAASTATSLSSVSRTKLSSKAKPFTSSFVPGAQVGWMPVIVGYGDRNEELPEAIQDAVQEDVYLHTPYSETLQEDVYLRPGTPPGVQRGRQLEKARRTMPSRTPSPEGLDAIFSEAATWFSNVAETIVANVSDIEASAEPPMPVKRTFIHYDTSRQPKQLVRSVSAPNILLTDEFQLAVQLTMPELHVLGECNPCAYFYTKQDGCRRGSECGFCHDCPAEEMKRRKKDKIKAFKAERRQKEDEQYLNEQVQYQVKYEEMGC